MGAGDPYVTLAQLKAYAGIKPEQTGEDANLTQALASATDEVDDHCNRQFNQDAVATPRIYAPQLGTSMYVFYSGNVIRTDDFYTTDSLVIEVGQFGGGYGTPWSASDYELLPRNGVVGGAPGFPFNRLQLSPYLGGVFFNRDRVRVTAKWGWAAVPASVRQATLLLAAENHALQGAPLGIAGFNQGLGIVKVHNIPQVEKLLRKYVVRPVLVG